MVAKKKGGNGGDKPREKWQCYHIAVLCLIEAVQIEDKVKRLEKALECGENLTKCLDKLPKPKHVEREVEMLRKQLKKARSGR